MDRSYILGEIQKKLRKRITPNWYIGSYYYPTGLAEMKAMQSKSIASIISFPSKYEDAKAIKPTLYQKA